ncbi:MAG: beta-lactamase family protein [Saprospiraceae bacterium]|nr:beta-lactamase family protein [Saprospiraceae bacterium]
MTTAFSLCLKRFVILLFYFIGINDSFTSLKAQPNNQTIDSIIQQVITDCLGPGGSFLIAHKNQIIYQKSFGLANLEWNIPLTDQSVFQIGSMTKQFTAIAILMLEKEGKLSTSDTLSQYLPDFPRANTITLHHLLTHTSGIRDYTRMKDLNNIAQKEMSAVELIDFFKHEEPSFLPGEKFEYNNSGYIILGHIIELVSGLQYHEFIEQHIFKKAGMTSSYYASDKSIIPLRAYGYHKKEQGYVNKRQISYTIPFSAGSLMSTVSDLLKWQQALNQFTLLPPEIQAKAFSPYILNNGEVIHYGYGWHIKEAEGSSVREHGGSIFGYKSMAVYYPSENIYVVGLTNCDCWSPTQLVRDVAAYTYRAFQKE